MLMFLIPDNWYRVVTLKKTGRGVFALRDIPAGTVIGDYTGKIIPFDSANEKTDGLYDMAGGSKYDVLADPKKKGVQLVNHSCANNCEMYPYQGHMLYFALRKICKGEEITINCALSTIKDDMPCGLHACQCGSKFCTGTMHDAWGAFDDWDKLLRHQFGDRYHKLPGPFGTELPPLKKPLAFVTKDYPKIYSIFASEKKAPIAYKDTKMPSITELRKRIRETGRSIALPKIGIQIDGIRSGTLLAEHI